MKKRYLIGMVIGIVMCVLMGSANADLIDRGGGLIYDTDLNITWMQNTNIEGYMTWYNAMNWASALVYQGYDDWRLPSITHNVWNWTTDPTDAEMVHLSLVDQINFEHPGPFTIGRNYYWSGSGTGWITTFSNGYPVTESYTNGHSPSNVYGVWAVRNGDSTPVPEPATMLLLGSGLIGLARYGRRKFFKK